MTEIERPIFYLNFYNNQTGEKIHKESDKDFCLICSEPMTEWIEDFRIRYCSECLKEFRTQFFVFETQRQDILKEENIKFSNIIKNTIEECPDKNFIKKLYRFPKLDEIEGFDFKAIDQ